MTKDCYKTLILIERGTFPDAICLRCEDLKECKEFDRNQSEVITRKEVLEWGR